MSLFLCLGWYLCVLENHSSANKGCEKDNGNNINEYRYLLSELGRN